MSPTRVIGWSLAGIVASLCAIAAVVAVMFVWSMVRTIL